MREETKRRVAHLRRMGVEVTPSKSKFNYKNNRMIAGIFRDGSILWAKRNNPNDESIHFQIAGVMNPTDNDIKSYFGTLKAGFASVADNSTVDEKTLSVIYIAGILTEQQKNTIRHIKKNGIDVSEDTMDLADFNEIYQGLWEAQAEVKEITPNLLNDICVELAKSQGIKIHEENKEFSKKYSAELCNYELEL